jgi:hypothetical protein
MEKAKEKHPPVQQSVHVDCSLEDAFRLFTESFGEWWPLAENCEIEPWEGGKVLERTRSGQEHEWGAVLTWDPPRRVSLAWRPGSQRDSDQTVDVDFVVEADGTRVTLTHQGWHMAGVETCVARFAGFVCESLVLA